MLLFGCRTDFFECFIALVGCLSEPDDYSTCFGVNLGYGSNLLFLFVIVVTWDLVDAYSIYPQGPLHESISKMYQRLVKVFPNR